MGGVQLAMTAEGEWNLTASALTIKGALVDLQGTAGTEHLDYRSTTRWEWGQKSGKVVIRGRPPVRVERWSTAGTVERRESIHVTLVSPAPIPSSWPLVR